VPVQQQEHEVPIFLLTSPLAEALPREHGGGIHELWGVEVGGWSGYPRGTQWRRSTKNRQHAAAAAALELYASSMGARVARQEGGVRVGGGIARGEEEGIRELHASRRQWSSSDLVRLQWRGLDSNPLKRLLAVGCK
jgi:hypothetical protein